MIIDMHAHTSKHPMRDLHVTSASIAFLENEAQRHGISRIFLMATYFPIKNTGVHNFELLKRIEGHSLFRIFGSLDVMNNLDSGLAELELLTQWSKIAGIKLYPGYQGFEPSEKRLDKVYALAEKYRLPIMLHGGELHECCPPAIIETGPRPCGLPACKLRDYEDQSRPQHIERPARDFPNVKFVVSHLSNPYFSELREVMKRCPNVFTDISGQFVSGSSEDTEEYRQFIVSEIQQFLSIPGGYERVLFATDFPIQSYADSLDLVARLQLSDKELKNVLALNALRVLGQK